MAFHSAAFLFFYIPVIFLFYLVIPGPRAKNVYLTIAGLIFYACGQWQGVRFWCCRRCWHGWRAEAGGKGYWL